MQGRDGLSSSRSSSLTTVSRPGILPRMQGSRDSTRTILELWVSPFAVSGQWSVRTRWGRAMKLHRPIAHAGLPVRSMPLVLRVVAAGARARSSADRTPEKVKYDKTNPPKGDRSNSRWVGRRRAAHRPQSHAIRWVRFADPPYEKRDHLTASKPRWVRKAKPPFRGRFLYAAGCLCLDRPTTACETRGSRARRQERRIGQDKATGSERNSQPCLTVRSTRQRIRMKISKRDEWSVDHRERIAGMGLRLVQTRGQRISFLVSIAGVALAWLISLQQRPRGRKPLAADRRIPPRQWPHRTRAPPRHG